MKTRRVSHLASLPIVLAVPLLAVSLTIGGSHLVRADQSEMLPHVLREMVFLPIMNAVQGLEQRLMSIETTVAALPVGISSPRVSTQQLCIADASGAQTCVSKAHLDALLRIEAQAEISQAPADTAVAAAPLAKAVDDMAETADVAEPSGAIPSAPAAVALVPSKSAHDNLERPQIEVPAVTTAVADPVSVIAADSDQPAPTPNEN